MAISEGELFNVPMIFMGKSYEHYLSVNIDILISDSDHIGFDGCNFLRVTELEEAIISSINGVDKLKTFFFINCNLPDYFVESIKVIFSKNKLFNIVAVSYEYEIILDAGSLRESPLYNSYRHLLKADLFESEMVQEKRNDFLIANSSHLGISSVNVRENPLTKDKKKAKSICVIS